MSAPTAGTPRTPITLIAGPLGSGKTTLLRRILDGADRRFAVIMNEFGELAVDSAVIRGRNLSYVELAGGCVCCSLAGEFEAAVRELIDTVRPEWIVLEATGVAEADALVYSVEENVSDVRLDCVVCVVDAWAQLRYPSIGYATRSQLESADLVIHNKIDLVKPDELPVAAERVRAVAPDALMVEAERCAVDRALLFGEPDRAPARTLSSSRPAHVHRIESFTLSLEGAVDRQRFLGFVASVPPAVYRLKGFVVFDDGGQSIINCVAGRCELESAPVDAVRLVFIGPDVQRLKTEIAAALLECRS
jgi:G3E family GTPase